MSPSTTNLTVRVANGAAFRITPNAIAQAKQVGGRLHCYVGVGGCGGIALMFCAYCDHADAVPTMIELGDHEITITLCSELAGCVQGATLDYGPNLKPPRFRWIRLNVPNRCACRRTYGLPIDENGDTTCMSDEPQVLKCC
jgi:Fe-S cluster assembly iron-binding protein IscA